MTLPSKLSGYSWFSQKQIVKICKVLEIDKHDVWDYFLTGEKQTEASFRLLSLILIYISIYNLKGI